MPRLNTFGYNFDTGSAPIDKAIDHARKSKASFHTIMVNPHNDFPLPESANITWQFYEALKDTVDDLILLVRFYSNREGDWKTYPDRARWEKALKDIQLPPNTYIDSRANEPALDGNNAPHNEAYVKWEIDNLKAVADAGHRYAVGAFSTGTPHESLIDSVYGDLWQAVDDYGGAIDMHLYGVYPLEAGELYPYDLALSPDAICAMFADGRQWSESYAGWLVGRYYRVKNAYKQRTGNVPLVLSAETILDRVMPDPYNSQWKSQFGMEQYQFDNRGLMTWERVMKATYPDLSFTQAVEKFLLHIRKNVLYDDTVRMALFGYNPLWNNYNWSTHKWSGHDVSDPILTDLHEHGLARVNTILFDEVESPDAMQPIVFDPPLFDAIVSVNNGYLNMRSDMSANSVDLGDITTTPIPLKLSKKTNDANGFTWYKFQQERPAAIVTGYIADVDKLNIEYTEDQQPEEETSDQLTPEQIEQIIEAEIDKRMELVPLDLFDGLYTWQVPRVMLPFVRDMAKIAHMVSGELRNEAMRANGEPVLSDITDAIYSASVPDDDSVAVTLSGILEGDNTITITPDTSEDGQDAA